MPVGVGGVDKYSCADSSNLDQLNVITQVTTKAKQVADRSVEITLGSGSKFGFENPF
jgi:hypothetical protein